MTQESRQCKIWRASLLALLTFGLIAVPGMQAEGQTDLTQENESLRRENQVLRSLLPTSSTNAGSSIANLTREVTTLRERLATLERESLTRGGEAERIRSERDKLRADIAHLYSDYLALHNALLTFRTRLESIPVTIDASQIRAQLSSLLAEIKLALEVQQEVKVENAQDTASRDPFVVRIEEVIRQAESISKDAEKLLPKEYGVRVVHLDGTQAAELFAEEKIVVEIVEGPAAKGWQSVKLWGGLKPYLVSEDGLDIEYISGKRNPGNEFHYEWSILPTKSGTHLLSLGVAGSASRPLEEQLVVKRGGWLLPLRFLRWVTTNYLVWLGAIMMTLIGHADKILGLLKKINETRKSGEGALKAA